MCGVCMCVSVYIYICMYVYICIYVYMYICIYYICVTIFLQSIFLRGFAAETLHGDKSQQERDWVMMSFKSAAAPILIATDVASRGV